MRWGRKKMATFGELLNRTQAWASAHGALTGLIGLVLGIILGIGMPIWQTYWVETPRLGVEIYAIDRAVQEGARIAALDDDALSILTGGRQAQASIYESSALARALDLHSAGASRQGGFTPAELGERLNSVKAEQRALPQRIEERQRQLRDAESITPERIVLQDVNRLNFLLPSSQEFAATASIGGASPDDLEKRRKAVEHFKSEFRKRLEESQKRYTDLQTQIPIAERRLAELKQDLEDRKGYFQITAVLNNSGRKSVSVRQLGLLRVYIGKGNYVDVKLNLQDYQKGAEVAPNGTRIATFHSDLLETFEDTDKSLVRNYWGQSVQGVLFIEDISGVIHSSPSISFAKGLYIKELYNRLTTEASKLKYQPSMQ
jgi:hypothetical protein